MRVVSKAKSFGGWRLLRAYVSMGISVQALTLLCKVLLGRISLNKAAQLVSMLVIPKLQDEFKSFVQKDIDDTDYCVNDGPIWWCWLQGLDNAPAIVKSCHDSLVKHSCGKEVVVLSEKTIHDYISMPDDIVYKYKKGIIPPAHYTDLIRIELLLKYGGTWVDSTCYITGDIAQYTDQPLFLFQFVSKKHDRYEGISNWWISARKAHPALKVLQTMLYEYWKRYDCVVEYFIFHVFYGMIMREHPEWYAEMPLHSNRYPLYLGQRMNNLFDQEWYYKLLNRCSVHKITYRKLDESLSDSFYKHVLKDQTISQSIRIK